LDKQFLEHDRQRLIDDLAYTSDSLDQRRTERRIELIAIASQRQNHAKPPTQDEWTLRCYGRRWKIERLWAWLQNYRRILVRHERYAENYLGFVLLGCLLILMRACL